MCDTASGLLQACQQIIGLPHVLTGTHVVLQRPGLRQRLAEQRLNACLTFSLVLARLADGYNLIRQHVSGRAHHLAAFWKDGGDVTMTKVKGKHSSSRSRLNKLCRYCYCVADF